MKVTFPLSITSEEGKRLDFAASVQMTEDTSLTDIDTAIKTLEWLQSLSGQQFIDARWYYKRQQRFWIACSEQFAKYKACA